MTIKVIPDSDIVYKTDKISVIIFHFNKKFLEDSSIPMWVLKTRGKTYYVDHVDFKQVSFSTKEHPDNSNTTGSIQLRAYLTIFKDGERQVGYIHKNPPRKYGPSPCSELPLGSSEPTVLMDVNELS
jgi:hypothetical protein